MKLITCIALIAASIVVNPSTSLADATGVLTRDEIDRMSDRLARACRSIRNYEALKEIALEYYVLRYWSRIDSDLSNSERMAIATEYSKAVLDGTIMGGGCEN